MSSQVPAAAVEAALRSQGGQAAAGGVTACHRRVEAAAVAQNRHSPGCGFAAVTLSSCVLLVVGLRRLWGGGLVEGALVHPSKPVCLRCCCYWWCGTACCCRCRRRCCRCRCQDISGCCIHWRDADAAHTLQIAQLLVALEDCRRQATGAVVVVAGGWGGSGTWLAEKRFGLPLLPQRCYTLPCRRCWLWCCCLGVAEWGCTAGGGGVVRRWRSPCSARVWLEPLQHPVPSDLLAWRVVVHLAGVCERQREGARRAAFTRPELCGRDSLLLARCSEVIVLCLF